MLLNIVLTPCKPTPKSNLREVVTPFAPMGAGTRENSFYRAAGGNGTRRRVSGAPRSGTPPESQANFRVGTGWGL